MTLKKKIQKTDEINKAIIKGIKTGDKYFHQDYDKMLTIKNAIRAAGFQIIRKRG